MWICRFFSYLVANCGLKIFTDKALYTAKKNAKGYYNWSKRKPSKADQLYKLLKLTHSSPNYALVHSNKEYYFLWMVSIQDVCIVSNLHFQLPMPSFNSSYYFSSQSIQVDSSLNSQNKNQDNCWICQMYFSV